MRPRDIRDCYVLAHLPGLFGRPMKMFKYEMVRYILNGDLNLTWHNNTVQEELWDFNFDQWAKHYYKEE